MRDVVVITGEEVAAHFRDVRDGWSTKTDGCMHSGQWRDEMIWCFRAWRRNGGLGTNWAVLYDESGHRVGEFYRDRGRVVDVVALDESYGPGACRHGEPEWMP